MSDRDSAPGSYVGLVPLNETPEHALALFLPRKGTARGQLAASLLSAPVYVSAGGSSPPGPTPSETFQSEHWRLQPKTGSFNQLFL